MVDDSRLFDVVIDDKPVIRFKKTVKDAVIPRKADEGSAGYDLYSVEETTIYPKKHKIISTGIVWEPSTNDVEMQIRPRSGLAAKHGITVLNSPGTIDASYRGVIGVILYNTSGVPYKVSKGDKIAQGVISYVPQFTVVEADAGYIMSHTERGTGGFGHTGK